MDNSSKSKPSLLPRQEKPDSLLFIASLKKGAKYLIVSSSLASSAKQSMTIWDYMDYFAELASDGVSYCSGIIAFAKVQIANLDSQCWFELFGAGLDPQC